MIRRPPRSTLFPYTTLSDLTGVVVATTDGTPEGGAVYNGRDADSISQVSLDGEQETTYNKPALLAAGLDEILSGGGQAEFAAKDTYAMLRNFPVKDASRYVQVDRNESVGLMIVGVMQDGN